MTTIKLIAGLGNPGSEYENTRHNAGFWFIDALASQLKTPLRHEKKFTGSVGKATYQSETLWLLKPETYMNQSGAAVLALATFYKIKPTEILIVHDELDIPVGQIRYKQGGGNGGHNGLKDIQNKLGTPNFFRLRLGIGHPGDKSAVLHYVLHSPGKMERESIDGAIEKSLQTFAEIASGDVQTAARLLHRRG